MVDFYQTRMGHTFYLDTMPRIAAAMETIGRELAEQNKLRGQSGKPMPLLQLDNTTREQLIGVCAADRDNTIKNDPGFRAEIARKGLESFEAMTDDELARAFYDADLGEIHPQLNERVQNSYPI